MILVYMDDGNCIEVEAAEGADKRLNLFVCFDGEGREVASFPFDQVQSYTMSNGMSTLLKEEVCDDVTLIPEEQPAPTGYEEEDRGSTAGRG